ncbi:MAG: Hpt domain-containing protein, partial [Pseudomonadota bacterium]
MLYGDPFPYRAFFDAPRANPEPIGLDPRPSNLKDTTAEHFFRRGMLVIEDEGVEGVLEDLPGIELDAALARLLGNEPLLVSCLKEFGRSFQGAAEEMNAALDRGDYDSARLLVHAIRGVAGNLSAEELFDAAGDLEAALTAHRLESIPTLCGRFCRALGVVLQSVKKLETVRPELRALLTSESVSQMNLSEIMAELSGRIMERDPLALETAECLDLAEKDEKQRDINAVIQECLERYYIEGAPNPLERLPNSHKQVAGTTVP